MSVLHNLTALNFLAVGAGAALGAWARWLLGLALNPLFVAVPLGTLAANVIGSYLVGVAVGVFHIHTHFPCCAVLCCAVLVRAAGTLAGVVGVAVTGYILDAAGGASQLSGWWSAHFVASAILLAASITFNICAKGARLFD